jgi:hypothetical protein
MKPAEEPPPSGSPRLPRRSVPAARARGLVAPAARGAPRAFSLGERRGRRALVAALAALAAAACAPPAPRARRAAPLEGGARMSLLDEPPAAVACELPRPSRPCGPARARARHVVIVSEDGMRPDAIARAKTPTHARLMGQGAYALNARTIRNASTLPSHAAMLSGFDVAEHGLTWNSWRPERGFIRVPTVFTAAGLAGQGAAAFVGKRKLEHIARPGSVDVFERPGFFCKKVVAEAAAYFISRRPQIEFVHFSDPDERGHAVGWMSDQQIQAIAATDRCLGTLVDSITAAGLERDTLVIVSADHGGFGRNHSGHRDEDRMIPWIAWGAGVRKGHRIRARVTTLDTAATALWALGHEPPPGLSGRPITEAFEPGGAP